MVQLFFECNICVCKIFKNNTTLFCNISLLYIQQFFLTHQTLQDHTCSISAISLSHIHKIIVPFCSYIHNKNDAHMYTITTMCITSTKFEIFSLRQRPWQQCHGRFELSGYPFLRGGCSSKQCRREEEYMRPWLKVERHAQPSEGDHRHGHV
jgi:hypothetical protein